MIRRILREPFAAALGAAFLAAAVAHTVQAASVTTTILLGPSNGAGNVGNFTGTVSLNSGSNLALGQNAISGTYQQGLLFTHTTFNFSAANQTVGLSANPASISTTNSSGSANLTYDNFSPGAPQTLNAFSANLSDGVSTGLTINSGGVVMSTSLGNVTLTPTFSGSISGITFTSSDSADASSGVAGIPGTYSVTLNGSVTGVINVPIVGNVSIGTLYTLPANTVVTFDGALPVGINLTDTGVPFGGFPDSTHLNNMLADFAASLGSLSIPFTFVAPLDVDANYSVGNTSSGLTSIHVHNTTLTANLSLSNLAYDLSGKANAALIPEPGSVVLGGMALLGFLGLALRRRHAA